MNLQLIRNAYLPDATVGRLIVPGGYALATISDPWIPDPDGPGGQRKEPGKHESCVPDGNYMLVPHNTATHPNVWCMVNEELGIYQWSADIPAGQKFGRFACLLHAGNSADNVEGCIAVGMRFGYELNKPWIYESQDALAYLRAQLGQDRHRLEIRPIHGTSEAFP